MGEPETQPVVSGEQRRENIPPSLFDKVTAYTPALSHAICGQVVTPQRAASLVLLLREASGATPDGRWLVGEALVMFLRGNLEARGISGSEQAVAELRIVSRPPGSSEGVLEALYRQDMDKVFAFVRASMNNDFDTAMTLIDADGSGKLLMMLCTLISATCPVHPLPLARA